MEDEEKFKMAAISGAAHAFRFKEMNPRASEREVIQYIIEKADEILKNIED